MLTIAIDPGVEGACAILNEAGEVRALRDAPVLVHGSMKFLDSIELAEWIAAKIAGAQGRGISEQLQAMPSPCPRCEPDKRRFGGTQTNFLRGMSIDGVINTFRIARIPFDLVHPISWKKKLAITSDKEVARAKAIMWFPNAAQHLSRKKDHNRAEALLLAHYSQQHLQTQKGGTP
jgi:crossover junction endodeoxyribonuclease RuvC